MLDHSALTAALTAALPAPHKHQATALTDAILAVLADHHVEGQLAAYAPLIEALIGRQITAGKTLISFGESNDMRSATITIGDVAGGHIVKDTIITLAVTIAAPIPIDPTVQLAQAQELFATLPLDAVPEPASLPPGSRMTLRGNPLFVGRDADLLALAAAIKDNRTAAITTGIGGVGKTQLAIEFVHRYGHYFAGGVFWLSFADLVGIDSEIAACGGAGTLELYTDTDGLKQAEQVQRVYTAWCEETPRLLIFDNCDDQESGTAEKLLVERLPHSGGCRVLVTSRRGQWSKGLRLATLPLDVLERTASIALLRSYREDISDADADAIAAEVGDLPLALTLAGSYLAAYRDEAFGVPATYQANLRKQLLDHRSMQGKGAEPSLTNHEQNVRATFALSYERLNQDDTTDALAIAALARVACLALGEPFPRELLLATLGETTEDEEIAARQTDAMRRLVALGLLESVAGGTLRMHRLIAAFTREVTEDAEAQAAVETAIALSAYQINEAGYPTAMQPILLHLRHVTEMAQERVDLQAGALCTNLGFYLNMIGDYVNAQSLYRRALAINEQSLGPTHPQTASSINNLAALYRATGDYAAALPLYQQALAINEQSLGPTHSQTAISFNNLAALYRATGDYAAALPLYQQALTISEQTLGPTHPQTATCLNNLAALYQGTGDYAAALPLYQQALTISEQTLGPTHPQTAACLNNLAALYQAMDDYTAALPLYERALAINEETLGPTHSQTITSHDNLAALYRAMGDFSAALSLSERAYGINEQPLDPNHPQTGISVSSLAINALSHGQSLRAQGLMRWAFHILETSVGPKHPDTLTARQSLTVIEQYLADPFIVFTPLLDAIVAVATGDEAQRADTEDALKTLEHQGWHLFEPVQHLWAGERNAQVLMEHLDEQEKELIRRMLVLLPSST